MGKSVDRATRIHLEGIRDQIGKILNPEGGSGASANRFALEFLEKMYDPDSCWIDYAIKK